MNYTFVSDMWEQVSLAFISYLILMAFRGVFFRAFLFLKDYMDE